MGRIPHGHPFVVVVTGSECTGKSTVARELAAHFHAPCSDEFVREYLDQKGSPLEASDVEPIALGQIAGEDAAVACSGGIVVKDTDLLSTVVYARHYYGKCPAWVDDAALERAGDLYLLLRPDLPWLADGQRDRPHAREEMHALFREALVNAGARFVEMGGMGSSRVRNAVRQVEAALVTRPVSASRRRRTRTSQSND